MYYNRILKVWVVDPVDYFLLSAILGSIFASRLKEYLSETKAMDRLKTSIIKKSKSIIKVDQSISNSKKLKIKKIYKLALSNRGGQFENFPADLEFSNESFKLAHKIKGLIERLAIFLHEHELKGVAKIFFKNGRLLLELILYRCRIDISYAVLTEGLSTQVIVMTATTGGALGFAISWFSAGASLVAPPVLMSMLLTRSIAQQIINQRDYSKFKKLMEKLLEDKELRDRIKVFFMDEELPTVSGIEMKPPLDLENNPLPRFDVDSDQTWEEFMEALLEERFGLVKNPTSDQIPEILNNRKLKNNRNNRPKGTRPKGKTVNFKDLIKEKANFKDPEDIIDAEIVKGPREALKVKVKNDGF